MYIYYGLMARQISISDEVYRMLEKGKGNKSFSEVIKEIVAKKEGAGSSIMQYAGILKGYKKWEKIERSIEAGRKRNISRKIDW